MRRRGGFEREYERLERTWGERRVRLCIFVLALGLALASLLSRLLPIKM